MDLLLFAAANPEEVAAILNSRGTTADNDLVRPLMSIPRLVLSSGTVVAPPAAQALSVVGPEPREIDAGLADKVHEALDRHNLSSAYVCDPDAAQSFLGQHIGKTAITWGVL